MKAEMAAPTINKTLGVGGLPPGRYIMSGTLGLLRRIANALGMLFSLGFVILACLFLYNCSGPDLLKRYDTPLSYSEAIREKEIHFPLPASSSDIYYGVYGDWQVYSNIVRFTAPVDDCIRHVDTVIAWHNQMHTRKFTYPRIPVTSVEPQGVGQLEHADWFTPDSIKHGLYVGKSSSEPEMWIDLDRGIFYFRETQ